jgi:Na+/H+ antiporter NhaD/arsenite permease-like protein
MCDYSLHSVRTRPAKVGEKLGHTEKQSQNVHKTFSDVEWITIFFFIGLRILVQ